MELPLGILMDTLVAASLTPSSQPSSAHWPIQLTGPTNPLVQPTHKGEESGKCDGVTCWQQLFSWPF